MNTLELHQIITGDGKTFNLNTNTKARYLFTTTPANWGMASFDDVTERSYQQDGVNVLAFYLNPRDFSIRLGAEGCSRTDLFNLRRTLIDIFRPNRNGQLTYVFQDADMTQWAIKGYCTDLSFVQDGEDWYEWGYRTPLVIRCYDPVWFNPVASTVAGSATVNTELVFPITFDDDHIYFGDGNLFSEATIQYTGNFYSYPVITVTGAFDTLEIVHLELGYTITYLGQAGTGESLIFDLRNTYSNTGEHVGWTVRNQAGVNMTNLLTPQTNLLRFRIEPDGVVPDGLNTIQFSALGTNGSTSATVEYNTRYIGI